MEIMAHWGAVEDAGSPEHGAVSVRPDPVFSAVFSRLFLESGLGEASAPDRPSTVSRRGGHAITISLAPLSHSCRLLCW